MVAGEFWGGRGEGDEKIEDRRIWGWIYLQVDLGMDMGFWRERRVDARDGNLFGSCLI